MRVAMISYYLPSGSKIGVGYQVHALANAMVHRGNRVTVYSSCGASDGAMYETRTVPLEGANRTFKFALALRKVDWSEFDVLHAHGDDYWLWGLPLAHVRTLHGSCLSEAVHVKGARERLRMFLLGLSELLATVTADRSVVVSQSTTAWFPWVHTVIPNGVDLDHFRPGERDPNPAILFVGTWGQRKRGWLLAEAFDRHVRPRIPNAQLWMVCEDAPAMPGVSVLGRVSADRLASLYARAWVFCLPSTYEGFGIPYVEAMAAGCPVVATDNPGARDVTANGRFGRLVDDGQLGPALVHLLEHDDERSELAEAGRHRAERFDLTAVAGMYDEIYREIADARG